MTKQNSGAGANGPGAQAEPASVEAAGVDATDLDATGVVAAGTVLWRPGPGGQVEIALVHRPKYDDWSLPKGKSEPGEHPAVTAVRETAEETGCTGPLGRPLGRTRYQVSSPIGPVSKVVHYFTMQAHGGAFTPSAEVDRVDWLPVPAAAARLTRPEDGQVLRRFAAAPAVTVSVLLVRHGRAGDRASWTGPDEERPLDAVGARQAQELAQIGPCFAVTAVHSADVLRCMQTVTPLAAAVGVSVEPVPALAEGHNSDGVSAAVQALAEVVHRGRHAAVCSQGGVIPAMLVALADRDRVRLAPVRARKGSMWLLSFADERLVSASYFARLSPGR